MEYYATFSFWVPQHIPFRGIDRNQQRNIVDDVVGRESAAMDLNNDKGPGPVIAIGCQVEESLVVPLSCTVTMKTTKYSFVK